MRLTVLGCRSGMPTGGQCSSSYLVCTAETKMLLDCGPGAATALSALGHPAVLDGIVISHLHSDHCYDLLPVGKALLASRTRYPMRFPTLPARDIPPRSEPIPLYLPRGGLDTFRTLAGLFPVATIPLLDKAFEVAFDVREYDPGETFKIGDCLVSLHGLRHAVPNCGIRIETADASLAYTGDTGVTDALVDLARGVDLFLAEATLELTDDSDHGHLSALDAAEAARLAGVGQLVLTHFVTDDPEWLAARRAEAERVFDGPVHLAAPARKFDVA